MSITELFREAAFEAEVTLCMAAAFDLACKSLRGGAYSDLIKEIIAKRIITCAQNGATDPDALCREALVSLGLYEDDERG